MLTSNPADHVAYKTMPSGEKKLTLIMPKHKSFLRSITKDILLRIVPEQKLIGFLCCSLYMLPACYSSQLNPKKIYLDLFTLMRAPHLGNPYLAYLYA